MKRSKIRAPQNDGEFVLQQDGDIASLLKENQSRLAAIPSSSAHSVFESRHFDFKSIRDQARLELINAAIEYTGRYAKVDSAAPPRLIFLSGHQPEMFHPGVWFKNFLLHRLSLKAGGADRSAQSINLIIDNDQCEQPSIMVPSGSIEKPSRVSILFDNESPTLPFETKKWQNSNFGC